MNDLGDLDTTILIHLKKPAHFFVLKHKLENEDKPSHKKCLSPFALPHMDSGNQYLNFWNMNQVICLKGKLDLPLQNRLHEEFDKLVKEEVIQDVEDLSDGKWIDIMLPPDQVKQE